MWKKSRYLKQMLNKNKHINFSLLYSFTIKKYLAFMLLTNHVVVDNDVASVGKKDN